MLFFFNAILLVLQWIKINWIAGNKKVTCQNTQKGEHSRETNKNAIITFIFRIIFQSNNKYKTLVISAILQKLRLRFSNTDTTVYTTYYKFLRNYLFK